MKLPSKRICGIIWLGVLLITVVIDKKISTVPSIIDDIGIIGQLIAMIPGILFLLAHYKPDSSAGRLGETLYLFLQKE